MYIKSRSGLKASRCPSVSFDFSMLQIKQFPTFHRRRRRRRLRRRRRRHRRRLRRRRRLPPLCFRPQWLSRLK